MRNHRGKKIDREREQELLTKAKAGDKRAIEQLLEMHYAAMYHLALRYTRDPERALDATQDSCVQVLRHLGQFRSESRFSSWMARIVINSARLRYRSDKRLIPMEDQAWRDKPLACPDPEEQALQRQQLELTNDYLKNGRDGDYDLFVRRFVSGESVKTISQETGVSVPAIKTRVHRARARLRADLESFQGAGVF
ncbi:MAG: sigma-70 family RNA polymerase sigma factor [Myxococcota bacterium]|nr:sigma-70 family RNA polymerase sigma factor [Myxococcota bacterium]